MSRMGGITPPLPTRILAAIEPEGEEVNRNFSRPVADGIQQQACAEMQIREQPLGPACAMKNPDE